MAVLPNADRPIVGWAAIVLSSVLLGLAVVLFGLAPNQVATSAERSESVNERQLLEARRSLELATLEVVAIRMLDGIAAAGDRGERLTLAAAAARSATAEILELAEGQGLVALEAEELVEELELEALENPVEGDLSDLFVVAEDAARYGGAGDVVTTASAAIQQLSFVSTLPLHVLIEGIAADVSVNGRSVTPTAAVFVDEMTDVVRTEGGWFGADAAMPLVGSDWIEVDEASEMFPIEADRLTALLVSSDLVIYDAWMRELGDRNVQPPFGVSEMAMDVDELQPELVAIIDQLVVEEEAARIEALASEESSRGMFLGAAIGASILALVGFVSGAWSIARVTRASSERADLAMIDALTGVGNRHELDRRTRALTMDATYQWHLIAMIDFDYFKLVNDVHGHAAGDAILVAVASRLQQIVDRAEQEQEGVVGSVIRMGGDEFLLTTHATDELDANLIRAELDAVRADSIEFEGARVDLGFSVGLVLAEGQNELADLMSSADLRVYDDKAVRARIRKASRNDQISP